MPTPSLERRLEALETAREQAVPRKRFRRPSLLDFTQALHIPDRAHGGLIPFALYPRQKEALAVMAKADRLVAVKARQIGVTTMCLALALFSTQYAAHRNVLVGRQALEEAKDSIRRLKTMHASIPDVLRPQAIVEDNVQSLAFANGSRIDALSSTSSIGRGRSAYLGVADEVAFWPEAERQMVALEAACERLIVVSTGDGPHGYLPRLWKQAKAGRGGWTPLFLDWTAVPSRDADFYRETVLEAVEPRLARREYPSTPEEAFQAPEGIYFERFDPQRNVGDIAIVPEWRTARAVDHGYHSPACLWIQTSPAGQRFVVAELAPHRLTTEEFAQTILAKERAFGLAEPPHTSYCDPAGRAANVQTAQSEWEIFTRFGLNPVGRASGVRDGNLRLMAALADEKLPLVVSRDCPWLIEALGSVRPDKHRPDIPDETSEYAHILDALRYGLVNLPADAGEPWTDTAPEDLGRPLTAGIAYDIFNDPGLLRTFYGHEF